jgi:hypothetical protein
MKYISLLVCLFLTCSVRAETIILPIQDLLHEIPNYESPTFNLGSAGNGEYRIGDIKKIKRDKKQIEKKLINILYQEYPDAKSIKIFNGNLIIIL